VFPVESSRKTVAVAGVRLLPGQLVGRVVEALAVPVAAEGRCPAARADHLDVERAQRRQDALDGVAHDGHDAAAAQQERLDGGVRRLRPVPRVRAAGPPAAGLVPEPLELASGQRGVRRDGAALGRHAQRHGRARAVDDAQAAKTSAGRKAEEPRRQLVVAEDAVVAHALAATPRPGVGGRAL